MPHWKLFTERDFLGACDLQGRDVTLTIAGVSQGELARAGSSKKERRPVISFERTPKRLVVNSTNGTTIAKLYGTQTEAWIGKRITLYQSETKMAGQRVDCIRVRPSVPGAKVVDSAPPEAPAVEVRAEMQNAAPGGPDAAA